MYSLLKLTDMTENNKELYQYWIDIINLEKTLTDGKYLRSQKREHDIMLPRLKTHDILTNAEYKESYTTSTKPLNPELLEYPLEEITEGFIAALPDILSGVFLKYDKEKAQGESIDIGDILSRAKSNFCTSYAELAVFSLFDSSRDYDSEIKAKLIEEINKCA